MQPSVRRCDEGYDFRVLVLDETWVVRSARRAACADALRAEAAFLPALAAALPVRVPQFVWLEGDVAVYRLIEGTPLVDEEEGVRAFLAALHSFDVGDLPIERPDWVATYGELAERFRPLVPFALRDRAEALFAEIDALTGFEPTFTHSDLGAEHLLCRDGRLVGVIDWGDARVGDPALDYSWLLNEPFPHWDVDDDLRRRARFYYRFAPFFGVHYDVLHGREPNYAKLEERLG